MKQKIRYIIITSLFIALLVSPLLFTDWIGGKVSSTENRVLASFPVSIDSSSKTFKVGRKRIENWISDNIGFRKAFVETYTTIKNKVLGLSTSSQVLIGNDGWYYYTGDHNIEVATGKYPLNENNLDDIAQYQQDISDYYHSIGKEYILMLTPSKASIYPEHLPMSDRAVAITPVDIVADYLAEHTNVIVYNSKNILLQSKNKGQLFHKTDTHWNDLGSYFVYRGLFDIMKQHGMISGIPIDVNFVQGDFRGELSAMMGNLNLLPAEDVPIAEWAYSFHAISEGEQFENAKALQNRYNPSMDCAILQNDSIKDGKVLQIYGDSQLGVARKIPCYFAEHFSKVFNYAIRNISVNVDEVADPDIIVFSCSERYIKDLLTLQADIPIVVDAKRIAIPTSDNNQDEGYSGMWLDSCNDQTLDQQGVINTSSIVDKNFITLVGWAADFSAMQPLSALYVKVGDFVFQCAYGHTRDSVSAYFRVNALQNTGFTITLPVEYLHRTSASEIQFIQIGSDGTYKYTPVKYSIK